MVCPPSHRVDNLVQWFIIYLDQAGIIDLVSVLLSGMIANFQLGRVGLRNFLYASFLEVTKVV